MTRNHNVSRRKIVAGSLFLAASGAIAGERPSDTKDISDFPVSRVVKSPQNSYYTYPHSNGFLDGGRVVLACPLSTDVEPNLDFISFDPNSGQSSKILSAEKIRAYYSISRNGIMLVSQPEGAAVADLSDRQPKFKSIIRDPGWTVAKDNDISQDGKIALLTRSHYKNPQDFRIDMVDVATGDIRMIMNPGWPMDHAHFSPFDPSWVCFCDNRPDKIDRIWVWHAEYAPQGKHIFKQTTPDGKWFETGHERAMFNKHGLVTVVYGGRGTAKMRGLFEVDFDGISRLISFSNHDFHCNVSRDGRWAVVSLKGSYFTENGRLKFKTSEEKDYWFSDVHIINMKTGNRKFLYRGTNSIKGQPYEVQPSISPDGSWVLLKDAREKCVIAVHIDQKHLAEFLS